ncbi:MAG TPA: DUF6677 family protein [Tepidisphaeraceae bacterium]|nr:DUF6677 family protein [Tepidisphaeraceae bacterium]
MSSTDADPPAKSLPPAPLVALAAWLIPGAGYVLIGQVGRGITVGVTILAMFVAGLLIGGIRVIDSPWIESPAQRAEREVKERNGAPRPSAVQAVLQKPWFIGQMLAGPVALVANKVGVTWERPTARATSADDDVAITGAGQGAPFSHARVYELGTLYTAVAGMLNLLAIIDSAYRASNRGNR